MRVVENHALPLVAVRVAIAGGSLLDPDGKDGLFTLDTLLVRDGTSAMSGAALSLAIDELGAPLSPTRFTTVTPSFDSSLALVGDIRSDDLQDLPAQAAQRHRTVVAGLGDQVCLGLDHQLRLEPAVEVGGELVEGVGDDPGLLPGQLTGADGVADSRPPLPQPLAETLVGDGLAGFGAGLHRHRLRAADPVRRLSYGRHTNGWL